MAAFNSSTLLESEAPDGSAAPAARQSGHQPQVAELPADDAEKAREHFEQPLKPAYRFGGELPIALALMRDLQLWVAWDYRWKGRRWTKPPFNPRTGQHASVSDPATWGMFDVAVAGMKRYGL